MYTGLLHLHSYWAYLVLLTILIALLNALIGWAGNKNFSATDRRLALFGLIAAHTQFLFGVILYFISPQSTSAFADMGVAMKDKYARLYVLEHPLVMLIAIVLITIGYSKSKRATVDKHRFRLIALLYGIGFLLIMSRIPWHVWPKS